jgi:AcrR family transcriptional regulator
LDVNEDEDRRRPYSSPLRKRQQEATRELILAAAAELVSGGRIHSFSMQEVAERAGTSYASVYRHFPTRELLLEGIYDWASERGRSEMPPTPEALEEIPGWVGESVSSFERHPEIAQALVAIGAALNISPKSRRGRDEVVRRLVAAGAPGLPEAMQRRAAAVIRLLASSHSWALLRYRFGLEESDAGAALSWALGVLVRDLRERAGDARASEGAPAS